MIVFNFIRPTKIMFTSKSASKFYQLSAAFKDKSSDLVRKSFFQCQVSKTRSCLPFGYLHIQLNPVTATYLS